MAEPYIEAAIKQDEDVRLLTGQAKYLADWTLPNMLHAAVLRSPNAHARITAIDTSAALAIPGVEAVFTFEDIRTLAEPIPVRVFELPGLADYLQIPLASDTVRYVGEAIAVAESRYLAEDALDAIEVSFESIVPYQR